MMIVIIITNSLLSSCHVPGDVLIALDSLFHLNILSLGFN